MNYKLTLKLEQARFPYNRNKIYVTNQPAGQAFPITRVPSLQELIDACGGQYFTLTNADTNQKAWQAICDQTKAEGNTREEAVANLWIALRA